MNKVEPLIEAASARVREQVPSLLKSMGWTYIPPLFLALVINAFGRQLLENMLPATTASILIVGLNVFILVYGWRYLEQRYHGLAHYMQFMYFTRERRDLRRMVQADGSDIPALTLQTLKMEQAADDFVRAVRGQA